MSMFYSIHNEWCNKDRESIKEICYVCKKNYIRSKEWNYKYCSIECEKIYKRINQ